MNIPRRDQGWTGVTVPRGAVFGADENAVAGNGRLVVRLRGNSRLVTQAMPADPRSEHGADWLVLRRRGFIVRDLSLPIDRASPLH